MAHIISLSDIILRENIIDKPYAFLKTGLITIDLVEEEINESTNISTTSLDKHRKVCNKHNFYLRLANRGPYNWLHVLRAYYVPGLCMLYLI